MGDEQPWPCAGAGALLHALPEMERVRTAGDLEGAAGDLPGVSCIDVLLLARERLLTDGESMERMLRARARGPAECGESARLQPRPLDVNERERARRGVGLGGELGRSAAISEGRRKL